jgi:hypothetical protein
MGMTIEIDETEMGIYETQEGSEFIPCILWAERPEHLDGADTWLRSQGLARAEAWSLYRGLDGLTLSAPVSRV